MRPICPKHGKIAIFRSKEGYWFCPECLDEILDLLKDLIQGIQEQ